MFPDSSPRVPRSVRKLSALVLLITLFVNSTFAAPEAVVSIYNGVGGIKENIAHLIARGDLSLSVFSIDTVKAWLARFGKKRQALDRIVISPTNEDGTLTVMQGERVVFSAAGYSGGDAIGGIDFKWTAQDAERAKPARNLIAGVFEAKRPGVYIVTAATDDGGQAQVTVNVYFNEGYGVQRLLEKSDADSTAKEKETVAAMVASGELVSRDINSKGLYNAASERQLNDLDKLKRAAAKEKQLERRQKFPNPLVVGGPGTGGSITNKDGIDQAVSQADAKRSKGGPSADDGDGTTVPNTKPEAEGVKKAASMLRALDTDGWDGTNWYTATAPSNETGTPAGAAPDAGATNGDYQINAPVLSLAGRGIDVNLALVYNSRLWSKSGTALSYDADKGFPGPGWSLGFGKMIYMGGNGGCMIVTPDGTRRSYAGTANIYSNGSYYSNSYTGHTTDGSFIDYSCQYTSSANGYTLNGYAKLPNGTTIAYYSPTTVFDQAYPTQITDAQGNYININYVGDYGPKISTISDTLGRTITFNYETGTSRLISVTGPGYNGTTRTYVRLHYAALTLNYAFASGYTADVPGSSTLYVLDAIYYPDTNTGYWFGDGDSYSSYGMIAKVVQQRGMSWSGAAGSQGTVTPGTMTNQRVYNFALGPNAALADSPYYTTLTESWAAMDTAAAVTNYAVSSTSTDQVITVTAPDGTVNKQTSHISAGTYLDGTYYRGEVYASAAAAAAGTFLTKTKTFLGSGDYGTSRPTRVEMTDELGNLKAMDFLYAASSYNQLITQKEYGYGGAALYRQTNNTYQNSTSYTSRHIFNLLNSTETVDAANNRLTRTEYQYDNNAVVNGTGSPNLVAATGVVHHNSTADPFTTDTKQVQGSCLVWIPDGDQCSFEGQKAYDPVSGDVTWCMCDEYDTVTVSVYDPNTIFRGNVTKTTTYSDAANLAGPISYDSTYDITGNQRTTTTNCCQQMSFGYTTATQFSQPETHTKGSSDTNSSLRMTESATYDFNTGAMLTSTDFNGLTTTTAHDAVLRPTLVTLPTGGKSTISYDDVNLISTQTAQLYDNTIVSQSSSTLNGRGQPVYSKYLAGASNWNASSVQYDNMGRKFKTFLPYDSAASPGAWTEYTYDHLSRVTQIASKQPDGTQNGTTISTSTTAYNETTARPDSASASLGQTVKTTDAWGRQRWAMTDDFGRLAEVVEPNPGTPSNSVNVALASNGATATASSENSSSYPASAAVNGDRSGVNWGAGGGWNDATSGSYPDWLQVDFSGSKTIGEIDVFTVQDNYSSPATPTESMTFSSYGIKDFDVQYWDGSAWVTVTNGSVTNNDKVWRKFTFSSITTSKIRVVVNNALSSYSRITEVEAWTAGSSSASTGSVLDAGSLKTSYSYDQLDQLTTVTQGAQTRSFKYDSLGRLTRQKLAEQTATINDVGTYVGPTGQGAAWSDAFTYDVRSNITKRIDARGVETDFSYSISSGTDPLNRLQSISYSTSGADQTYTINPANAVTLSYVTTGDQTRVASVVTAGINTGTTETNSYDTEGRISDYTLTLANRSLYPMKTSYEYDDVSRLKKITYPKQYGVAGTPTKVVTPTYDSASRLDQLTVDGQTQLSVLGYNAMSQVTSLRTGVAPEATTGTKDATEQYGYDDTTGLLTSQTVTRTSDNSVLLNLAYGYDRGGSVGSGTTGKTGQLTHITNNLDHNKDRSFEFDALGRLKAAKGGLDAGATTGTAHWTQNYSYDRYGNKTGVAASGTTVGGSNPVPTDGLPLLAYDTTSNRINTSGWQYDLAGNMIRGQNANGVWQRFEYDAAGRLVKIEDDANNVLETYTYGADRNRLTNANSSQTTYYAWGGSAVIQEYTEATGSTTPVYSKSYVYAGSRLLSTGTNVSGSELTEFHHPDRLGTKVVTNPSANNSYEQSTLPFGTELTGEETGTGTTNQKFTSYDRSNSTGLDYAVNRTYSQGQGRFTQVDPASEGLNLYAYVGNDPISFGDPSGLNMASPGTRYGGSDITYYLDGMQVDARTAWGALESGGGYIDGYSVDFITVIDYWSAIKDGNTYSNWKWLGQSVHVWGDSGSGESDPGNHGGDDDDLCSSGLLTPFSLRDESSTVPIIAYIHKSVAQDFDNALQEINAAVPGGIGVTEVFRTYEYQKELYDAWIKRGKTGYPVARPGTSRHEGGFAVDVKGMGSWRHSSDLAKTIIPIFEKYGFDWGDQFSDQPHFQADFKKGGYKTGVEANKAAEAYYKKCILGG